MAFEIPGVGKIPGVKGIVGTIGDIIGSLANPYGTPSKGEWNIQRGIFQGNDTGIQTIFFYEENKGDPKFQKTAIDQISDSGGRRVAVYEYPYRDGQRVEDLGRRGEKFTFNIKFFGANYQVKFKEFLDNIVNRRESGKLTHPIRGVVPCKFQDYEIVHRYDEWNAVTIRATFIEDNQDTLSTANLKATSPNSALRSALQALTDVQSFIGNAIFTVGAALLIPAAIKSAMTQRLDSIVGQASRLLGQLSATFSTDAKLKSLAQQASKVSSGASALSIGTINEQTEQGVVQATLPPTFQVGFSPADQATIENNIDSFVNANQITTQQAVFSANQARAAISAAIAEVREQFGNLGYDIELQYRGLAIQIQQATESSISFENSQIKLYTVPFEMSLRMVAFNNGLNKDRQNDIEALNPYIGSVNIVPRGTLLVVPSS